MIGRCAAFSFLLAVLPFGSACSADSVTPPEPEVEHPGSFVAAQDTDGLILLLRTLRIVPIDSTESLLEAIHYQGTPSSYAEATAWAKDPELPVLERHALFSLRQVLSTEHEVVWFRTLSQDELAGLR